MKTSSSNTYENSDYCIAEKLKRTASGTCYFAAKIVISNIIVVICFYSYIAM